MQVLKLNVGLPDTSRQDKDDRVCNAGADWIVYKQGWSLL